MKVQNNKVVSLAYRLEVDGRIADQAGRDNPLEYIHGTHMLLPKFEQAVEGKEPGDSVSFTLSPEEGYGVHNPQRVVDLPKEAFMIDGVMHEELMEVGRILPMMGQDGSVIQATVKAVGDKHVSMDFNHPMAGKTLNFTVEVVAVRDATESELTNGLHGEYLPQEEHECRHGRGHCHKHEGEGEGECCHKHEGDGECCHHGEGGHCHDHEDDGCCCKD
ncbi:MAG: peptidylprolyl isomerase [Bacteroidales bacterium]|nr:peptidylprolyl isomerase [Bacteroidales bacterium]